MIVSLLHTPLFWTALTIASFLLGQRLYQQLGNSAFIPPILTGIVLICVTLELTGTSYQTYMQGGEYLHLMLGPVVVMLAAPCISLFMPCVKNGYALAWR